jgi:hypothetical protein
MSDDSASTQVQPEPAFGGIAWAEWKVNQYEPLITGSNADITKVYEQDYIEAAAIFSVRDAARYERLKGVLKNRGVAVSNWDRRVTTRAHEIRDEGKRAAKATAQRQAATAKASASSSGAPTWAQLQTTQQEAVNGYILLLDIRNAIQKFIRLTDDQATVLALWLLFTWVFEKCAEYNPFIRIISSDPNCGKSTLLRVLNFLARSAWLVSSSTKSAFIRTLQTNRVSFLLDEADAFLQENEDFRNVLDAAALPEGRTQLSIKVGDDWKPIDIVVFIPMAIASIKKLRGMATVEGRSIHIWLKRATKAERKKLTKARQRTLKAELLPIADRCARWAMDNADQLVGKELDLPFEDGRDCDKWEPLIIIADYLDADLGKNVRAIAAKLIGAATDDQPFTIRLLADIKSLFDIRRQSRASDDPDRDKYHSSDLCAALISMDESPWLAIGKRQKPIDERALAGMVKNYRTPADVPIMSRNVRITVTDFATGQEREAQKKGYLREDFEDAWARYLPQEDEPVEAEADPEISLSQDSPTSLDLFTRPDVPPLRREGETAFFASVPEDVRDASKNGTNPNAQNGRDAATDKSAETCEQATREIKNDLREAEIDRLAAADADGLDRIVFDARLDPPGMKDGPEYFNGNGWDNKEKW